MTKRLALTIAGAVSLGSYEAGVMFEVLDALAQHNTWVAANGQPDARIEIDVLTGASAGGMTAAMTSLALLFDGASMDDPYANPMYSAWVEEIDITKLLARQPDEDVSHSVLSSDCVIAISKKHLTPDPSPAEPPHAALAASGEISLGLAISNLNGVDYARPTMTGGEFVYTRHEDQRLFQIDRSTGYIEADWETIRATAVACGAFPVAFRTQELMRSIADYLSDPFLLKQPWGGKQEMPFCYTDGGVFYNEPLGMAMNLVQALPGGRLEGKSRGYLFIAPKPKTSDGQSGITADNANFKILAQSLAGAVMGQSEFQDWVMAESFNDKLQLLDERARELHGLFASGTLTAAQTRPVTDLLLPPFFTRDKVFRAEELAAARAQLQAQYASDYTFADAAQGAAWLDAVLVLELAADLHSKEEMYIYDFVADPLKLAGGGLSAFTGFFHQAYRDHDYDYGRSVAQVRIAAYREQAGSVFEGLHWVPKPIRPIDSGLDNLPMSAVDEDTRQRVCDQILKAADDLLGELGLNAIERWGVKKFAIQGQVEKMLALESS